MDFDELQRAFFDAVYTWRIPIAVVSVVGAAVLLAVAWRAGWLRAARRHPARATILLVVLLAAGLPLTWYVASPLWIRTELFEPAPAADVEQTARPVPTPIASPAAPASARATPAATSAAPSPDPTPFAARTIAAGPFSGTDDFHFGRGTASIVETTPGTYHLRFDDFSVRNGPDLFVYLSPKADGYAKGALELGRLKATDGAFGYDLPAGIDPSDFASAIVWCKQFSHLFAVAPLTSG